jgi:outer membrane protein assembly factor BamB
MSEADSITDDFSTEMADFEVVKTGKFDRSWKVGFGGSLFQIPLIHDSVLYFGCCNQNVYAVDARKGEEIWRFKTNGPIFDSSPTISDGILYIGSYDHNLYAIDAAKGKLIWKFQTSDKIVSSPIVENGIVYFGSRDNFLYAVDANEGRLLWKFRTFAEITSTPAAHGGSVFIGSYDHNFYALDALTGRLKWKFRTEAEIHILNQPLIHRGIVYFGSFDNNLYAVGIDTGKEVWRLPMGIYGCYMSPILHDNLLYCSSRDGNFYALTMEGKKVWSFTKNEMLGMPAISNGDIYLSGGENFNLYCLGMDGKEKWNFATQGLTWLRPAVWENKIYFSCIDCHVYVLDAVTGALLWKFRTEGSPSYFPPPHETFEIQLKIPKPLETGKMKKEYNIMNISEHGEVGSFYKSRVTYQVTTQYREKGRYQAEEEF